MANIFEELRKEQEKAAGKIVKLDDLEVSELRHRRNTADKYHQVMRELKAGIPELAAANQELNTAMPSLLDKKIVGRLKSAIDRLETQAERQFKLLDSRNTAKDKIAKALLYLRRLLPNAIESGNLEGVKGYIAETVKIVDDYINMLLEQLNKGEAILEKEIIPRLDQLIHEHEAVLTKQEQAVDQAMDRLEEFMFGEKVSKK